MVAVNDGGDVGSSLEADNFDFQLWEQLFCKEWAIAGAESVQHASQHYGERLLPQDQPVGSIPQDHQSAWYASHLSGHFQEGVSNELFPLDSIFSEAGWAQTASSESAILPSHCSDGLQPVGGESLNHGDTFPYAGFSDAPLELASCLPTFLSSAHAETHRGVESDFCAPDSGQTSSNMRTTTGAVESQTHVSAIPAVTKLLVPRKRQARFRPTQQESFTRDNAEARAVCVLCRQANVRCSGVSPNEPCEQCSVTYPGPVAKNRCATSTFYKIVEWGPVFHALSVSEDIFCHAGLTSNPYVQEIYRDILGDIATIAKSSPRISIYPLFQGVGCEIETEALQRITESAFRVFASDNSGWSVPRRTTLLHAISSEVQRLACSSFITLQKAPYDSNESFWEKALAFCANPASGISVSYGLSLEPIRIGSYIGYIAARYLELSLVNRLQDFSNRKGRAARKGDSDENLSLMIRLIGKYLEPSETLRRHECGTNTQAFCQECEHKDALTECDERRQQLRRSLHSFLFSLETKIDPESKLYTGIDKTDPSFLELLRDSFATEIGPSRVGFFHLVMLSMQVEDTFARNLAWILLTPLRQLFYNLSERRPDIAYHNERVSAIFTHIGQESLFDLMYEICLRRPDSILPKEMRRKMLLSRMFLAISNQGFNTDVPDMKICLFVYIKRAAHVRLNLIAYYDFVRKESEARKVPFEQHVQSIVQNLKHAFKNDKRVDRYRANLRTGQRWKDLVELFGKPIILIGSPFMDDTLCLDVPRVVLEGSDAVFNCVKECLATYFWWIRGTCDKLNDTFMRITNHFGECTPEFVQHVAKEVSRVIEPISPSGRLFGALRCEMSGTPPRELIGQFLLDETAQLPHVCDVLLCCAASLRSVLLVRQPKSKSELAQARDMALSTAAVLSRCLTTTETQLGYYMDKIIASFGIGFL